MKESKFIVGASVATRALTSSKRGAYLSNVALDAMAALARMSTSLGRRGLMTTPCLVARVARAPASVFRAPTSIGMRAASTAPRNRLCATVAAGGAAGAAAGEAVAAVASPGPTGLLAFARSQPYKFNIIIATFKTALCDLLVQRYIEKREEISWSRNAIFWAFGCFYLGGLQWFIYVDVFKVLWPNMQTFANMTLREKLANPAGIRALFGQVAFDNFIHYPLIYFPFFYVFKQGIQGGDSTAAGGATDAATRAMSVATSGLSKYRDNCVEDNMKMWALWIPGDLIVYAVPIWIRMPLNHGFSFIWTCYLSFLRGDDDAKCNPATASANRGAGKLPWTASGIAPERTLGD